MYDDTKSHGGWSLRHEEVIKLSHEDVFALLPPAPPGDDCFDILAPRAVGGYNRSLSTLLFTRYVEQYGRRSQVPGRHRSQLPAIVFVKKNRKRFIWSLARGESVR